MAKQIKAKMSRPQTWTVSGSHVEETVYGPLFEAIKTASEIALIETEWPKKGNVVTSVAITRDDLRFTLTLQTPNKPDKP